MAGLFAAIWFLLVVYMIGKNIGRWLKNEYSPVLTEYAQVTDKRRITHHHNHGGHLFLSHSYLVTFTVESGEEITVTVNRREYSDFEIGDRGMLTHQGTRLKEFA